MTSSWQTLLGILILVGGLVLAGCGGGAPEQAAPASGETPGTRVAQAPPPPSSDAVASQGTSSVTGRITYEGEVPNLRPLKMDADPGCLKKHSSEVMPEVLVLGDGNSLANVFIRVTSGLPAGQSYRTPGEPVVMDQRGCRYKPHVLGIMVDQPFKIINSDGLLHNVHSLPKINTPFNRAMPANVTEAEYKFAKEEVMFKIKCDVHPWMGAWVGVLPHPFFSVSGADGDYSINGLSAGTYEIEAWHERLGSQTMTVTVADGETGTGDFVFTR